MVHNLSAERGINSGVVIEGCLTIIEQYRIKERPKSNSNHLL